MNVSGKPKIFKIFRQPVSVSSPREEIASLQVANQFHNFLRFEVRVAFKRKNSHKNRPRATKINYLNEI